VKDYVLLIDDGSLRVYDLSTTKVVKAIRGLAGEISSLVCIKRPGSELRDVWLACGKNVSWSKSWYHSLTHSPSL
jgi:hypothetical protein